MSIVTMNGTARNSAGTERVPLYRVVYNQLKSRLEDGIYRPGTLIPSETKLRQEFGVSLITIRRAIHELVLDGFLDSHQGVGNFVREPGQNSIVVGLSSFTSDVVSGRLRLVRSLMEDSLVQAPESIAAKLGVQAGSMLRKLVRLDYEGGVPLALDEVYMPPSLAMCINREMAASPVFMHMWQEETGVELVQTQYEISVTTPTKEDREMLQIGAEIPLLVTGELIFDSQNNPAMFIVSRYRGDRCKLSKTVTLVQRKTSKGIVGE